MPMTWQSDGHVFCFLLAAGQEIFGSAPPLISSLIRTSLDGLTLAFDKFKEGAGTDGYVYHR